MLFPPVSALVIPMPRLPRLIDDGLVYHAINRGNNRQVVFRRNTDFRAFLDALRKTRDAARSISPPIA